MSASEPTPAGGDAPSITPAQIKETFELFDADSSGAIDREELRVLCFALGRTLNDEQLEMAFEELDADGNGTIEYEELEDFILNGDQQDEESISARLQFALRRKLLAAKAKGLIGRLGFSAADAPTGVVSFSTKFTAGAAFAGAGAPDGAAAGSGAAQPGFALDLEVGPNATFLSPQDLGANDKETGAMQFVLGLSDTASEEEAEAFGALLSEAGDKFGAAADDFGLGGPSPPRILVEGPMPSPLPGQTGRVLVITLTVSMDLTEMLDEVGEMLEGIPGLDEAVTDDSDDEGKAQGDDGEYEGYARQGKDVKEVFARILDRFSLSLKSALSLEELLGTQAFDGTPPDAALHLKGRLSKSVLHILQSLSLYGLYKDSWARRRADSKMGPLAAIMASEELDMTTAYTPEVVIAAASTAGISAERPCIADATASRLLPFLVRAGWVLAVDKASGDEPGEGGPSLAVVELLQSGESGTLEAMGMEAPSSLTAAMEGLEGVDVEELEEGVPLLVGAGAAAMKWIHSSVVDLRAVRVAGGGLGMSAALTGLRFSTLAKAQADASSAWGVTFKQKKGEAPIPGILVVSPSPEHASIIRAATASEHEKPGGKYGFTDDWRVTSDDVKRFTESVLLPGVGNADYVEPFEVDDWNDTVMRGVFKFKPEQTALDMYCKVLGASDVTPPSGVPGPFVAAVMVPASAMPPSALTTGQAEGPAGSDGDTQRLQRFTGVVTARCAEVSQARGIDTQPQWLLLVDSAGGAIVGGNAGFEAAAVAAAGLPEGTAATVNLVDFGTGAGIVHALSDAAGKVAAAQDAAVTEERKEGSGELVGTKFSDLDLE